MSKFAMMSMNSRGGTKRGKRFGRRHFFKSLFLLGPLGVASDVWCEPEWLRVRNVQITPDKPTHRFVHFTDVHHKGDRAYLKRVIDCINGANPDFVCFTGDIVEHSEHLAEALEIFQMLKAPLYGIPGNHDYWADLDFDDVAKAFAATGGRWLMDQTAEAGNGRVNIIGSTCSKEPGFEVRSDRKNILLIHYPVWADRMQNYRFDLMLAGHSHGGQVRLPGYGSLLVPFGVGQFEMGLYATPSGPLYVNPGIGYFYLNVRFFCRPEITVFEI